MRSFGKPIHRVVPAKTRVAANAARRAKAALPKDPSNTPAVFVVKADRLFTWEIRRIGSLVLQRGVSSFADEETARAAGLVALTSSAESDSGKG